MLTDDVDLKEVERRALTAYHEDGLLDIFIGGYLLFYGLSGITEFKHRIVVSWFLPAALGTLLYSEAKKRVTYPRLGYVRFTNSLGAPCVIIGVIMVGIGALHLRRFIGRYPKEA